MHEPTWISAIKVISELLRAILWPAAVVFFVLFFRKEIRDLLERVLHAKILGQELELDRRRELDVLKSEADSAASVTASIRSETSNLGKEANKIISVGQLQATSELPDWLVRLSEETKSAARLRFLQLYKEVGDQVREINAGFRPMDTDMQRSSLEALEELKKRGQLAPSVVEAVQEFLSLRNEIVHGAWTREDMIRAIDVGQTILQTLRAVPRTVPAVHHTNVPIWKDPERRAQWFGCGVILLMNPGEQTAPQLQIFPTTRRHFREGMRVAWEWSRENQWDEAWYADPDDGLIKQAWSGSLEFIGRSLEEIPGL